MATDYDKVYRDAKHALGAPTQQFVSFFEDYPKLAAKVLDVGCGQGRDALFIARLGHHVTAVDLSPSGIADLQAEADAEGLSIQAQVADICTYKPSQQYDVIVVDRVLHMLQKEQREAVLKTLCTATHPDSVILIADEPRNIAQFQAVFTQSAHTWVVLMQKRGFLFVQRGV